MDGAPVGTHEHAPAERQRLAKIATHYDQATADYRHWSAALHMHFGYWRWPLSPFNRAAMVEGLSAEVHARLELGPALVDQSDQPDQPRIVVDLGCGVGSAARQLATRAPSVRVLGLSLSPRQVELGEALSATAGLSERVELRQTDYRATGLAGASVIGAYAIESACYDAEGGAGLIREAARILRPGARLVVADGFRRTARVPRLAAAAERRLAAAWALPGLSARGPFLACLAAHGFEVEAVEDVSLRVLPSVLHVPIVSLGFRLREGFGLERRREANARASLWGLLGALLWPRRFAYYVITARRR